MGQRVTETVRLARRGAIQLEQIAQPIRVAGQADVAFPIGGAATPDRTLFHFRQNHS